jgi:hypothetical protein
MCCCLKAKQYWEKSGRGASARIDKSNAKQIEFLLVGAAGIEPATPTMST